MSEYRCVTRVSVIISRGMAAWESWTFAPDTSMLTGIPASVTSRCNLYPFQYETLPCEFFLQPHAHSLESILIACSKVIVTCCSSTVGALSRSCSSFRGRPRFRFAVSGKRTSDFLLQGVSRAVIAVESLRILPVILSPRYSWTSFPKAPEKAVSPASSINLLENVGKLGTKTKPQIFLRLGLAWSCFLKSSIVGILKKALARNARRKGSM